jgi:hypothetical protein
MTIFEAALLEMTALLDELHFNYMLIGGLAVALWGEPRATLDVDLTIWVEAGQLDATVAALSQRLAVRTADPLAFVRRSRVLPVLASNGIPVDLLFAAWPVEKQAIEQAVVRQVAGAPVRVVGLDHLLLLKLISDRPKDLADAEALLRRHRGGANVEWLGRELAALAEAIAQPEILARFKRMLTGDVRRGKR